MFLLLQARAEKKQPTSFRQTSHCTWAVLYVFSSHKQESDSVKGAKKSLSLCVGAVFCKKHYRRLSLPAYGARLSNNLRAVLDGPIGTGNSRGNQESRNYVLNHCRKVSDSQSSKLERMISSFMVKVTTSNSAPMCLVLAKGRNVSLGDEKPTSKALPHPRLTSDSVFPPGLT